jgi:1-phosphofructokinase
MYRDLVYALKADGCRVLLDTSGEALPHALDAGPHVIKPNLHELEALVGTQLSTNQEIVKSARSLLSKGIELAAVSMGAEGALFVDHEHAILARPPNVKVRSTVGAGDAMVAGILAGQLGGMSLPDTARLASAFALDALTRNTSAMTSRGRIGALMDEITIQELG